jgi:GNAT superfamily N-acetyltransferase
MPDPIVIRLAADTSADVLTLSELRRKSALEIRPGSDDDAGFQERFAAWHERESDRRLTWLAEASGQAVGLMNLAVFERMPRPGSDPGRWGYLANAYVLPGYRNRGVGTRLIEAVLAHADAHGFARVVLSPSQRSVPFYRRAGFGPAETLLLRSRPPG